MQVKQATKEDVSHLVKLSHALFQEDAGRRDKTVNLNWANEQGYDYFSQFLEQEQTICLLAKVDEAVVGYLTGYVQNASAYRLVKSAELESMFIGKPHRGQGIGTALAHHFTQWAQENGAEIVTVTAYTANQRAVNFYQTLGFRPKQTKLALNL